MRCVHLSARLRIRSHITVNYLPVDEGHRFLTLWEVTRPAIDQHRARLRVEIDERFRLRHGQVVRTLHHTAVLVVGRAELLPTRLLRLLLFVA